MKATLKNAGALFLWAIMAIVCGLIINAKTADAGVGIVGDFTAVHPTRIESSTQCKITLNGNTGGQVIALACDNSGQISIVYGPNAPLEGISSGWAYGWYQAPYGNVNVNERSAAPRPASSGLARGPTTPTVNRQNCDLVDIHIDEDGFSVTVWCP